MTSAWLACIAILCWSGCSDNTSTETPESDSEAVDAADPTDDDQGVDSNDGDDDPPDINPPDTNPPDTNAPDTNPPDTDPPDTDPPDTDPPDTNPPDADPDSDDDASDEVGPDTTLCPLAAAGPVGDGVIDLNLVENPDNVLSFFVDWQTTEPVATTLEVDCGDYRRTYQSDDLATEHRVFVMGFYDGAECTLCAMANPNGVATSAAALALNPGPLPDALPSLEILARVEAEMAPGWTLLNISNQAAGLPPQMALIDSQGRYRWYHQRAATGTGADIDTHLVSDGVLMSGNIRTPRPAVIGWEGDLRWEGAFPMHHEIRVSGAEPNLMYLGSATDCPQFESHRIIEINMNTDEVLWDWSFCEHYVPDPYFEDWAHTNATVALPGEGALLLSARNQNSLHKIDRETGEVIWTLGYRGRFEDGFRGDFEVDEAARFLHQHSPEIQPNGNILLFDNGIAGVRNWSRALEISYDEEEMTAEMVWEFRPEPDVFAPTWSDADRLPNGNTLVSFGVRTSGDQAKMFEVDADAEVVWEVTFPGRFSLYRADRIAPPVFIRPSTDSQ